MIAQKFDNITHKKLGQILLLLPLSIFLFNSCKKQNLDYTYDYRRNQEAAKESNVRLVNLSLNNQMTVNGDSLTNFYLPRRGNVPPEESTYPGTKYFPKNGLLGLTWNMPQDLFGAKGTAVIKTDYLSNNPVLSAPLEFQAVENYKEAKDYYLLIGHQSLVVGGRQYVEVPRSVTAPSKPDHFKIRVLNLSLRFPSGNPMENLNGPYTLAFADGTAVSASTTGIQPGAWSEYIEVPYGTYQFKILTADGRQVPAVGQEYYSHINTALSTMTATNGRGSSTSGQTYAPVQTFQPGGVYTIVVHPAYYTWDTGQDDIKDVQNGFRIIPDITEPQNTSYSRIQLANALPESQLQLRIKGKLNGITAYSTASAYQQVISGKQLMEVLNADGKLLLSQEAELLPGGNYTLWAQPGAPNETKAVLVSNNLNGSWYTGEGNNGGNAAMDRRISRYPFHLRFLNLCPELPYATFTDDRGVPYGTNMQESSGVNLKPGIPFMDDPYTRLSYDNNGIEFYQIMAYTSGPNKVPGDWLANILPIVSTDYLVARPQLYTNVNRRLPAHEPGVYTVALVGHLNSNGSPAAAKFMIVKHTK